METGKLYSVLIQSVDSYLPVEFDWWHVTTLGMLQVLLYSRQIFFELSARDKTWCDLLVDFENLPKQGRG